MHKTKIEVTDPEFYDNTYYASMDLRYLNNLHSGRFRAVKKVFPIIKDMKTLDVGCGGGGITNLYWQATKNLIGVDFSPAAIEFAKYRYPHLQVRVMDVFDLENNFGKGTFEVVIANDIIEHVNDHDKFLVNCREVLGEGGYCILSTDLDGEPGTSYGILRLFRACLLPFGWDGLRFLMLRILELPRDRLKNYHENHVKTVSRKELVALLEKHGFKVEKILVYNLIHGFIRNFILDVFRILTRLEVRDHQLIIAKKM